MTLELIERVREGSWNPDEDPEDHESRDALAARGYWLAFRQVRNAVELILAAPDSAAPVTEAAHRDWCRTLFQPAVAAGLLDAADLAGYRTHPIYIQGSRHVPPRPESVLDAMSALFDLLRQERETSVRAVLGHWLLGCIHPFPDGNGRVARFLMNAMLASGGFPWTVIDTDDRDLYMEALERASVEGDIGPFAGFLGERVRRSMKTESRTETQEARAKGTNT